MEQHTRARRLHNITMRSACKHTWDSRGLTHKAATIMHCKAVERTASRERRRKKEKERKSNGRDKECGRKMKRTIHLLAFIARVSLRPEKSCEPRYAAVHLPFSSFLRSSSAPHPLLLSSRRESILDPPTMSVDRSASKLGTRGELRGEFRGEFRGSARKKRSSRGGFNPFGTGVGYIRRPSDNPRGQAPDISGNTPKGLNTDLIF